MLWVYDPHRGGKRIPPAVRERTRQRILAYAEEHYAGKYIRLEIRFKGKFCYIDAYCEPDVPEDWPPPDSGETREECIERLRNTPIHLCRLRYFTEDRWSVPFYTYSRQKYEPCILDNGRFEGTLEDCIEVGAVYLEVCEARHGAQQPAACPELMKTAGCASAESLRLLAAKSRDRPQSEGPKARPSA
jgi:hypothetical protein